MRKQSTLILLAVSAVALTPNIGRCAAIIVDCGGPGFIWKLDEANRQISHWNNDKGVWSDNFCAAPSKCEFSDIEFYLEWHYIDDGNRIISERTFNRNTGVLEECYHHENENKRFLERHECYATSDPQISIKKAF